MSEDYTLKRFDELVEGEFVTGSDGKPTMIVKAHDIHEPKEMFKLTFEDAKGVHKTIEASGNHLWYVETSLDRSMHSQRLRNGIKLLKYLPKSVILDLHDVALNGSEYDTALIDMVELLKAHDNPAVINLIVRVAESIGPVSEENTVMEDLATGASLTESLVRFYHASLFAQQLLALSDRKLRKRWPVIVGQVMTTSQLTRLSFDINIPEIKPFVAG